jgi:hypothetical protein
MDVVSAAVYWLQQLLFGSKEGGQLLSIMVADPGFGGPPSLETIIILSTGLFLGSIAMVSISSKYSHQAASLGSSEPCLKHMASHVVSAVDTKHTVSLLFLALLSC